MISMSTFEEGLSYLKKGFVSYKNRKNKYKDFAESVSDESKINWLKDRLIDDASKETLDCVVKYRKTHNHQDLFGKNTKYICQQYLIPEFTQHANEGEIYADCGTYNGETVYLYLKDMESKGLMPSKIYAFEPNNLNEYYSKLFLRNILTENECSRVEMFNQGVSDKTCSARLTMDGSCSTVCEEGGQRIDLIKLDDIQTPINCIKMDLEGHEISALKGAERHIREDNPRLAICVYHKPNDIWDIPKLICEINPTYKFYLRQHFADTKADNELIIYGVIRND